MIKKSDRYPPGTEEQHHLFWLTNMRLYETMEIKLLALPKDRRGTYKFLILFIRDIVTGKDRAVIKGNNWFYRLV